MHNPQFDLLEKQSRKRLNRRIKQAHLILRNRAEIEEDSFSDALYEIILQCKNYLHTLSCGNPNDWDLPSTPEEHHTNRIKYIAEGFTPSRSESEDFALEWQEYAENFDWWLSAVNA